MTTYASASDVAIMCQNLLGSASTFSTSTSPALVSVTQWIAGGDAIINSHLASWRYATPAPSTATAYSWLVDLNALYAAARAEMTRTNITLSMGERTRGQVLAKDFWDQLSSLRSLDLTLMGLTRTTTGGLWTGGISLTDKDEAQSDSDKLQPRFRRGQFQLDGANIAGEDGTSGS